MTVRIDKDDAQIGWLDRSGTLNEFGREGFSLGIGGVMIDFEDEADIEEIAKRILYRLGWKAVRE